MRRALAVLLAAGVALIPAAVLGAGADVAAGSGARYDNFLIKFTEGAADPTPGTGLDGHGAVMVQYGIFEYRAQVRCVHAIDNNAVVIAEVTETNDTGSQTLFMWVRDNGTPVNGQSVDAAQVSTGSLPPSFWVAVGACRAGTGLPPLPLDTGNFLVRDGAE